MGLRKYIFLRFYDELNLGDDLFFHILTERYNDRFIVFAKTKRLFMKKLNVKVIGHRGGYYLMRIAERLSIQPNPIVNLINKTAAYVYVGGSIFIDNNHPKYWGREELLYSNITVSKYILGANYGPEFNAMFRNRIKRIVNHCTDVCFRDRFSYNIFKASPSARLSTDIAFSLKTHDYEVGVDEHVVFSIIDCYKKFSQEVSEQYEKAIADMATIFVKKDYRVTFMSFCKNEGDEEAINRIISTMSLENQQQIERHNYRGDLNNSLALLASSKIIIGSRFHANILGLVFGKKVLPMAYSNKTLDILKDIDFPGQVIDIRKIDKLDVNTIDFDSIPIVDVSAQKKLAETQFQELDKVLTRA